MKMYFWLGMGVMISCLTAGMVGQKVFGQPERADLPPSGAGAPLPGRTPTPTPAGTEPRQLPILPGTADALPIPPVGAPNLPRFPQEGPRQVQGTEPIAPPPPVPPTMIQPPSNAAVPSTPIAPPSLPVPNSPPSVAPPFPPTVQAPTQVSEVPTPNVRPSPGVELEKEPTIVPDARPGKSEPAVSLEWVGPQNAKLGQPMACQLVVHNSSAITVHHVTVRAPLPPGVTHHSSAPAARCDERLLTWNLGTIEAGQMRRLDVQLVAQQRGPLNCQAAVTFTAGSSLQVLVKEPLLQLKVLGPEKVVADEAAVFLITLSNPGDGATENIRLKVTLPEGLEHNRGKNFEVDAGQLAAKESRTVQMVCKAKGTGAQKVAITALAEANLTATDTAQIDILHAKLDLAIAGPKLRFIDRHAHYALKVANPGTAPATNVMLTEIVPAGFKFHAASASGKFDEATRTVTWALGDVMPGQNREVTLELVATTAGSHRLAGQAVSARGVKGEAETKTLVEGVSSLLLEMVDLEDPVEVGADTAYEIRVTNIGTKTETNLQLVCSIPDGLEFRDAKSANGQRFRVEGREVIFDPLVRLAPRADAIFRVQVKGLQPGNARFRAQVRADGLTEPIQRDEVTRIYNDDSLPR